MLIGLLEKKKIQYKYFTKKKIQHASYFIIHIYLTHVANINIWS